MGWSGSSLRAEISYLNAECFFVRNLPLMVKLKMNFLAASYTLCWINIGFCLVGGPPRLHFLKSSCSDRLLCP